MENAAMIIQLPFSGFYESVHADQLDEATERDAENFASGESDLYPEAVGMAESDLCEILSRMSNRTQAYESYSRKYVSAFEGFVKQETGFDLQLTFDRIESPRFYNFDTDRIFAQIPLSVVEKLRAAVTLGNLAEVIKERHESRSGFCSFYTTDIEEWTKKPVSKWDHNELETLLIAWMRQEIKVDADEAINDDAIEFDREMGADAWQDSVNWNEFEAKCAAKKAGK